MNTSEIPLRVRIRPFTTMLAAAATIVVAASTVAVDVHRFILPDSDLARKAMKLLYVDLELNVPSFFSAALMLTAAMLIAVIFLLEKRQGTRRPIMWGLLGVGFVAMAFDETVSVHERAIEPMRSLLGQDQFGILYFAWVIPGILVVGALGLVFLRFFISLPPRTRFLTGLAAVLFLTGALGLELVEGYHVEQYGKETALYFLLTTVEEAAEMSGVIVFIRALVDYLANAAPTFSIAFVDDPSSRRARVTGRIPKLRPFPVGMGTIGAKSSG